MRDSSQDRTHKGVHIECIRRSTTSEEGIYKIYIPAHLRKDEQDTEAICSGYSRACRLIDERTKARSLRLKKRQEPRPILLPAYLRAAL
jgi:hypothetical protein